VVLKTSASRHALFFDGFSGNLHFSGHVEKWYFQSENEMKTSLPPPPPPSLSETLFGKQGLCSEISEAQRHSSFYFLSFAVPFFASISLVFFMP